jgi:DNA-binding NtrC family response regulator
MSWAEHHEQSEKLAAEAELAHRAGETDTSIRLYSLAAEQELLALSGLDPAKRRTFSITAVSVAALFYKAQAFNRAERIAAELAENKSLLHFASLQLTEIRDRARDGASAQLRGPALSVRPGIKIKVAILTNDREFAGILEQQIRDYGGEVHHYEHLNSALESGSAVVFAQWTEQLFHELLGSAKYGTGVSGPAVVVLVPSGDFTAMRQAREVGAYDVLFSPPHPLEIRAELDAASKSSDNVTPVDHVKFDLIRKTLIGQSPSFKSRLDDMRLAAQSDANVLILGETGTGKEMVARAIHHLSRRANYPYTPVNCAAVPEGLLESAMFGDARGAFTGAEKDRIGWFEEVGSGTLLLEELGAINPVLQTRLLRSVEQRVFRRVGGEDDLAFLGRLIAATSVDIEDAVRDGRFRSDLLGRINQFRITLPPLRERKEDIPLLIEHFLQRHAKGREVEFSKSALDIMQAFDYPMNIRQLENAVVAALARAGGENVIRPRHLPTELLAAPADDSDTSSQKSIRLALDLPYHQARDKVLREVDRFYFRRLLVQHHGNMSLVARVAGLDRKTFAARLNEAFGKDLSTE